MKTKTFKYDYYTVTLPSDLIQEEADWLDQMCSVAINQARDLASLWCVPCAWQAKLIKGGPDSFESVFRVRRRCFYKADKA